MSNQEWTRIHEKEITTDNLIEWARKAWFNAQSIQSVSVSTVRPLDNQVLMYSATADQLVWSQANLIGPTGPQGTTGVQGSIGPSPTGSQGPTGAVGFPTEYYVMTDTKSSGTVGGQGTVGNWFTRTLNTLTSVGGTRVSLASNVFTLGAGNWYINVTAPFFRCGGCRTRLYDLTADTALALSTSTVAQGSAGTASETEPILEHLFTLAVSSQLVIEYRIFSTTGTTDLGRPVSFAGSPEVYTQVNLTFIGT